MIQNGGVITYEIGDTVQVIKGNNQATIGIVLWFNGAEMECWGRTPESADAKAFVFRAKHNEVQFIGRAKIRPAKKGEEPRTQPRQPAPRPPAVRASLRARSLMGKPRSEPGQAPQFGGVDSAQVSGKPQPPSIEPLDAEALRPVLYKRQSAHDLHPKLAPPQAPQPQETTSHEQQRQEPNPAPRRRGHQPRFRKKASSVQSTSQHVPDVGGG